MVRKEFSTSRTLPRYLIAVAAAVVAGVACALGSAPAVEPSGYHYAALLIGEAAALAVLAVAVLAAARRAGRETIERMSRHILWAAFVIAAAPGLAWFVMWLSGAGAKALFGLAAVVVGGLPVLAAYRWREALPVVLVCCLLGPVAMLVLWGRLFLFLPFSLAVTVGWLLVLTLLGSAASRRTENVIPSN